MTDSDTLVIKFKFDNDISVGSAETTVFGIRKLYHLEKDLKHRGCVECGECGSLLVQNTIVLIQTYQRGFGIRGSSGSG